jgi:TolA-binding protein
MKNMRHSAAIMTLAVAFFAVGFASNGLWAQPVYAQQYSIDDDEDINTTADKTDKAEPPIAWDAKRLLKLDRNVRKLERTIARVEGKPNPPILIEPDPEVVALQATVEGLSRKLDDHSAAFVTLNGQLEDAQHQISLQKQEINALNAKVDTLTRRIDLMEANLKDINTALAPPPPPPPSQGSADADFAQAYGFMTDGQLDEAQRAFESFVEMWPESKQTAEAWFRLGQIHTMRTKAADALTAYATSLKGWPKTTWAPDATVRMAQALFDTNRPKETCAALMQFDKTYAKGASAGTLSLAKSLKARAACRP